MKSKVSWKRISFFIFVKYVAFFFVLALIDKRFYTLVLKTAHNNKEVVLGTIFYVTEVLFVIVLMILILFMPFFILFKLNSRILYPGFILILFLAYFIYEAGASYVHYDINGIINGLITVLFFFIFFRKYN